MINFDETLQSKIMILKNIFACFRVKSQTYSLSTFDQFEFKKIIF